MRIGRRRTLLTAVTGGLVLMSAVTPVAAQPEPIGPSEASRASLIEGVSTNSAVLRIFSDQERPVAGGLLRVTVELDNTLGQVLTNARLDTYIRRDVAELVPTPGNCGAQVTTAPIASPDSDFIQIALGTVQEGAMISCELTYRYAPTLGSIFFDDFEVGAADWVIQNGDRGDSFDENYPPGWNNRREAVAGSTGASATEHVLTLSKPFTVSDNTLFAFSHFWKMEQNRDGGLVEGTIDGGDTWFDLDERFQLGFGLGSLYTGRVSDDFESPLAGRRVYTGASANIPRHVIDLAEFAGEEMLVRFRLATDNQNDRVIGSNTPGEWTIVSAQAINGEFAHWAYVDLFSDQGGPLSPDSVFASVRIPFDAPEPAALFEPTFPIRFIDSRSNYGDEGLQATYFGRRSAGMVTEVQITGEETGGTIPDSASAVVLNVTAIGPDATGYITVFPCTDQVPNSASINYTAGVNVANEVIAELSPDGTVCLFTSSSVHVALDGFGYLADGAPFRSVGPARILDTRSAGVTIDDRFQRSGRLPGGRQITLDVAGRAGVPADATAVVVNAAAVNPGGEGYLTVHPCLPETPLTSSLNYVEATTRSNEFTAEISAEGTICIATSATTDVVMDVAGYLTASAAVSIVAPARVLDSRESGQTVDGRFERIGRLEADGVVRLDIAGRAELDSDASTALINVAAVNPSGRGFITVYTCGLREPVSSLNFERGVNAANDIVADLNRAGELCLYTSEATDLIVDVVGGVS